jgi:hypothetical protein
LPKKMFYRPGCGLFNQRMIEITESLNYNLALGTVYPNDPVVCSSIINYYYLICHIEKGDIVILHDRKWTAPMLQWLLPWMISKSLKSVILDDVCL